MKTFRVILVGNHVEEVRASRHKTDGEWVLFFEKGQRVAQRKFRVDRVIGINIDDEQPDLATILKSLRGGEEESALPSGAGPLGFPATHEPEAKSAS